MKIKSLLRQYGLYPRKGLAQNFLADETVLPRIIAAAELGPEDLVLEVGPGLGFLTRALAQHVRRVIAVELDRRLVTLLQEKLADCPNLQVVAGDILQVDIPRLWRQAGVEPASPAFSYKVVANLPYYITSAVLRRFLESPARPALMVLMVQKEVAQRLVAGPGQMSLLAVSVQFYARPTLVSYVPAGAFYPRPKVDSAIVRLAVDREPRYRVADSAGFFQVVQAGFGQKRKQLKNALAAGLERPAQELAAVLIAAGVDPQARAQSLSVEEWVRVYERIALRCSPASLTPRSI